MQARGNRYLSVGGRELKREVLIEDLENFVVLWASHACSKMVFKDARIALSGHIVSGGGGARKKEMLVVETMNQRAMTMVRDGS